MENIAKKRSEYAKTLKSVIKVNDSKIDDHFEYYIGIKDTDVIPINYFSELSKNGFFIHTRDKMARGGRAIDVDLINPISGRCMTGSSSGTAINVFLGVNDIGIGTDGGGSVLAPACSLNLFGFISKKICYDHLQQYSKTSTDGITFTTSIGYLAKNMKALKDIIKATIGLGQASEKYDIKLAKSNVDYHKEIYSKVKGKLKVEEISLSYEGLDRKKMIEELSSFNFEKNILITFEGPVDIFGYGDSIIGHYGSFASDIQEDGHKYYLKVVNMLGLSAIIVPSGLLSTGILIIGGNTDSSIATMIRIAEELEFKRSELEEKYFSV